VFATLANKTGDMPFEIIKTDSINDEADEYKPTLAELGNK
jgi:hypothetical protein